MREMQRDHVLGLRVWVGGKMKMRGIKPDFWTDDKVVDVGFAARLLFIGLWNLACDNGHVKDAPRTIKRLILPDDDVSVSALLVELHDGELIERGDGWIIIPTLPKHQKIDIRYFRCCDRPGCVKPDLPAKKQASKPVPERKTRRAPSVPPSGTPRAPHDEGEGEGEGEEKTRPMTDVIGAEFETWYQTYPRHEARAPALKAYKAARKKAPASVLLDAITRQKPRLTAEASGPKFIPLPATRLNGQRWLDETAAPEPVLNSWMRSERKIPASWLEGEPVL